MKLGLITRNPKSYRSKRICEEAEKLGLTTQAISFFDLDFKIGFKGMQVSYQGQGLPEFDFLVTGQYLNFVPQWQYLLEFYKQKAIVLNQTSYLSWPRLDKISQHFLLAQAGLPVVDTQIFGKQEKLMEGLKKLPIVVKGTFGHQGGQVFKITKKEQIEEVLIQLPASYLLVQEYLQVGQDLRIICLAGKIVGAMKRIAVGDDFRANYSVGGKIESYPIEKDESASGLALQAARLLKLDLGGVDLMQDNQGQWRILEVNRTCQFEGFEKATGINLAQKIVEFLIEQKND